MSHGDTRFLRKYSKNVVRICMSWSDSLHFFRPNICILGIVWIWLLLRNQQISHHFYQMYCSLCIQRKSFLCGRGIDTLGSNAFYKRGNDSYRGHYRTRKRQSSLQWGTMKNYSRWTLQTYWRRIFRIFRLVLHRCNYRCRLFRLIFCSLPLGNGYLDCLIRFEI